jgi:hypothetical protein
MNQTIILPYNLLLTVSPDGNFFEGVDGVKLYELDRRMHRIHGPAIEWADGSLAWCFDGKYMTFAKWLIANTQISDEVKVMLKLKYG